MAEADGQWRELDDVPLVFVDGGRTHLNHNVFQTQCAAAAPSTGGSVLLGRKSNATPTAHG